MNVPWSPHRGASKSLALATIALRGALCGALFVTLPALGLDRSAESVLAGEPPELVERLMEKRLLVLEEAGKDRESFVIAYVVFERSVRDVVGLLRQADRQVEYRPELDRVETIRTFENGRIDEQQIRIMFTKLVYRVRYRDVADTEGRLEWTLDRDFDNDLGHFEGFWELYAFEGHPNRTLARFGSMVDVGPAVPRFIQKSMSRKTVLRYLGNARSWIDSDGEWRP